MIKRSGPNRAKSKTIRDVLSEPFRDEAIERARYWVQILEIEADQLLDTLFPSDATGSVDGVNIAVKKHFRNLFFEPRIMAKLLGSKNE